MSDQAGAGAVICSELAGKTGAVVLAAGASRRLPGANKLLMDYRGRPLLAHALDAVRTLGLAEVMVVSGHDPEPVEALAASFGLASVRAAGAQPGMGLSIATGIRALGRELVRAFIVLGDMPDITPDEYARLANAHAADPRRICVPVFANKRGHPVLFGADFFDELAAMTGDRGAREVLMRHERSVIEVPAGSPAIMRDIDTAADFIG